MFYIVRYWLNGQPQEQTFDDLEEARDFLHHMAKAQLFVWLGGREEYMEG